MKDENVNVGDDAMKRERWKCKRKGDKKWTMMKGGRKRKKYDRNRKRRN